MTRSRNSLATLVAFAAALGTVAACSSGGASTTAGGGTTAQNAAQRKPLTLTVGTDDFATYQGAMQIQHFATEVASASHGTVTIKPVFHPTGTTAHWDQSIAGMVKDGRFDMGMVRSQAWDQMGVTTLRALTAPFLITSDSLTASVLAEPTITQQALSGLPKAGFTGVGLFPDGLRHPFGFHGALKGVADYQGKVIRTPYSHTSGDTLTALGAASVTDAEPNPATQAGADGEYQLAPDGSTATGNVTFYPKVNVLFLSAAAQKKLSKAQLAAMAKAAKSTLQWASTQQPSDADEAKSFCQEYGKIAGAEPAQVAGLVAATRGVVTQLQQDATTAKLIGEITALKAKDQPATPVTACPAGSVPKPQPATPVDGTYGYTITAAAITAAGSSDQGLIDENAGTYVETLSHGRWKYTQTYTEGPKKGTSDNLQGQYTYRGGRLKIFFSHQPGDWSAVDVVKQPDGSLVFSKVVEGTQNDGFRALDQATYTQWKPTSAG